MNGKTITKLFVASLVTQLKAKSNHRPIAAISKSSLLRHPSRKVDSTLMKEHYKKSAVKYNAENRIYNMTKMYWQY